jgi:hypothetical protein
VRQHTTHLETIAQIALFAVDEIGGHGMAPLNMDAGYRMRGRTPCTFAAD